MILELFSLKHNVFVQGRQISEKCIINALYVRGYHKQEGKPRTILKIDIMKAYDSLSWDFLFKTMYMLKFPKRFVECVYDRVTTA